MKTLVESCFALSIKLLKKDLRLAREHKTGIEGFINISFGKTQSVADYYVEYGAENDYLVIHYGIEEQRIKLAESKFYLGPRSWFICDCERRVAKLYLPLGKKQFKCRHCYKLVYELSTFSPNSKHGRIIYQTNRMIKFINTRERMRSIFYDGKHTKRFNRFSRLSEAAGWKFHKESECPCGDINRK